MYLSTQPLRYSQNTLMNAPLPLRHTSIPHFGMATTEAFDNSALSNSVILSLAIINYNTLLNDPTSRNFTEAVNHMGAVCENRPDLLSPEGFDPESFSAATHGNLVALCASQSPMNRRVYDHYLEGKTLPWKSIKKALESLQSISKTSIVKDSLGDSSRSVQAILELAPILNETSEKILGKQRAPVVINEVFLATTVRFLENLAKQETVPSAFTAELEKVIGELSKKGVPEIPDVIMSTLKAALEANKQSGLSHVILPMNVSEYVNVRKNGGVKKVIIEGAKQFFKGPQRQN